MTPRNTLLTILLMAALLVGHAAEPISETFKSAPSSVFPLLDKDTRLDMLDYYSNGMSTPSKNELGGNSRIDSLTDDFMHIDMTAASDVQLARLSGGKSDLVLVISTIETPAPDSRLAVYSADWTKNLTDKAFNPPAMKDWLTSEGRKHSGEVLSAVPFMIVGYSYDPSSKTLTLTNNIKSFIGEDVYKNIAPALTDTITYIWNGSKFQRQK